MKISRTAKAVGYLDEDLIAEAEGTKKNKGLRTWIGWGSLAAGLVLLVTAGAVLVPKLFAKTDAGRYKEYHVAVSESNIIWPWEQLTTGEKYTGAEIDGRTYYSKMRTVTEALTGEKIGTYTISGYDQIGDKEYEIEADAYRIRDVSANEYVAVQLDGDLYVFRREGYIPPMTLGELFAMADLPKVIKLRQFSENGDGPDTKHFELKDDRYIWDILTECADAAFVEDQDWFAGGSDYICFSVTSEALGVYKNAMYVTADGYLWTNAFDYQYFFEIGRDAASKIIEYSKKNSSGTEYEPYLNAVAGTVTEINETYITVDDTAICRDPKKGLSYKILLNDKRLTRYVNSGMLKAGDLVQVLYRGGLDEAAMIIDTATQIDRAYLSSGNVSVRE
ncbi:MAG: hypothetical protein J6Z46_05425 [Lachnospiraceae bacterium]|nr:hypothetical protein [Lachnospiraceae bacterium]